MPYSTARLPLHAAKELALALLPHVSTDDFTPSLSGAWISADGKYAYASDRYSAARYDLTNLIDGELETSNDLYIPRKALIVISRLGPATLWRGADEKLTLRAFWGVERSLPHSQVEVREGDALTLHQTFSARGAEGARPPVERLFDQFQPGGVTNVVTTGEQIGKFTSYSRRTSSPIRITFPEQDEKSNKPAPFLVEVGERLKAFVQSYRTTDPAAFGAPLHADTQTPDSDR